MLGQPLIALTTFGGRQYEGGTARSTRVLQYCHFDNFVLLTSSRLDGVTSQYPRENIIAGNYILADMQAYLDKRHRQQNKEILIRHSPGIGECFFVFKYSINRKNKKNFLRGL